jgi:hypothetical protein
MTKDEALRLALEALETLMIERGSIYDTAITAVQKALANEALDRKAEHAKELGLDYEPDHGWTPEQIAGMARLKEAQDKKLAQRTWVDLTLKEIEILFIQNTTPQSTAIDFARAIESKFKEKNS